MSLFSKALHLLDDGHKQKHSEESLRSFERAFIRRKQEIERLVLAEHDAARSESYRSELLVLDTLIVKTRQRLKKL